jgi:hypothetical protein
LVLEWKDKDPVTTRNFGMSQFELVQIRAEKCKEDFQIGEC